MVAVSPVMFFLEVRAVAQQQTWAGEAVAGVWPPKEAEVVICSENSLKLLGHDVCVTRRCWEQAEGVAQ